MESERESFEALGERERNFNSFRLRIGELERSMFRIGSMLFYSFKEKLF